MTGGQAECAFNELELMKRAVAQRVGWSAAWFAFERWKRERIGLWAFGGHCESVWQPTRCNGVRWDLRYAVFSEPNKRPSQTRHEEDPEA
jgi:hypothetical protein